MKLLKFVKAFVKAVAATFIFAAYLFVMAVPLILTELFGYEEKKEET